MVSLKNLNLPLKLLVENEIFHLTVWANPLSDPKRGADHVGALEKSMLDVCPLLSIDRSVYQHDIQSTWISTVRKVWEIDPAIAVFLTERFHNQTVHAEVGRLVRSGTHDVLHVPEALPFLVGDKLDQTIRRDLKVCAVAERVGLPLNMSFRQYLLLWDPIPPILAVAFFEKRYNSEPLILQYAHRVLEEHPVAVTFFFVPQIVQALRYDVLGMYDQCGVTMSYTATRICCAIRLGDRQDFSIILPSNHMEYEGELLQGRCW